MSAPVFYPNQPPAEYLERLNEFATTLVDAEAAAAEATAQAATATSEAGIATTQAGIATTQAGISTAQAGIATTQADTATAQAVIATDAANAAGASEATASAEAGTATTQAGTATAQAVIATTQAGNAATSATNAAASEQSANGAAGATKWVSGTTYAEGDVRWSPADYTSYRRKTAGAGATDPSADSTNWAPVQIYNAPTQAAGNTSTKVASTAFVQTALGRIFNDIGVPGTMGFALGICPPELLPAGMSALAGTYDRASDNYGNYQYTDGSVMCWIPAFYYLWGTGANGVTLNQVSIKALADYADLATANAAGYALHRAFYDGGLAQPGFFCDKYIPSYNAGTASSLKNGIVLTSAARGSLSNEVFSDLTGAPAAAYYGAIAAAKTRGANFFCWSRFIRAALALLAYAHGQASTATTYCAWYHATNNFPKGCNNNALGDAQDGSILYVNDGNGTYICGKTGSANLFSRTTHNGQNSGVADLNGLIYTIEPGLTSNGTNLYILKTSAQMKALTAGNTLATDLWGATGIAALYDDLGTTYGACWATGANRATYFGAATQVFSEAVSGNAWNFTGFGGPLAAGIGGTNAFGNDLFYDYKPNEMCPLSGSTWGDSSGAGVWFVGLNSVRGTSYYGVGFRAALYL